MAARSVVILGAARTPIGRYGGLFKELHPAELGAVAARAALERAAVPPDEIDEVIFGHVWQEGVNSARDVGHRAGITVTAPAHTINKACASGLQAIVAGAQGILLGESECVLAGGVESMSRMPAQTMGETAEALARQYRIPRGDSDRFAYDSQQKAEAAQKAGHFTREIAPVAITANGATTLVGADALAQPGMTLETLAMLPGVLPAVDGQTGIVTDGSSAGSADGGAALVLASDQWAADRGLAPLATIAGWASTGVDPHMMGIGPVSAIAKLRDRFAFELSEFDLVELNEAFAAHVLAVLNDVPIAPEKLNVNGGAIALGDPIGCSGARIVVTLLHELQRRKARTGLATLGISGGMGMALAVEML